MKNTRIRARSPPIKGLCENVMLLVKRPIIHQYN